MQLSRRPLSLRPRSGEQVPSLTAQIARASNLGGTTATNDSAATQRSSPPRRDRRPPSWTTTSPGQSPDEPSAAEPYHPRSPTESRGSRACHVPRAPPLSWHSATNRAPRGYAEALQSGFVDDFSSPERMALRHPGRSASSGRFWSAEHVMDGRGFEPDPPHSALRVRKRFFCEDTGGGAPRRTWCPSSIPSGQDPSALQGPGGHGVDVPSPPGQRPTRAAVGSLHHSSVSRYHRTHMCFVDHVTGETSL